MQENPIQQISVNVQKFLARESKTSEKINQIESKLNKMNSYFVNTPIDAATDHAEKSVMNNFVRKGITSDLQTKSFSGKVEEAGILITPTLSKNIISAINAKSPMRQLASVEKISTRSLDIIIEDGKFSSGWVGEVSPRDETETPALVKKTIHLHETFAQPKATQSLLDDAENSIEHWLKERLVDSFVKLENEAFINGNGEDKPHGLLTNEHVERINVGEVVTADILIKLINSVNEGYLSNASFLMNRNTLSAIQSIQDQTGRFIWQQSLTDSMQQNIFGIPVIISSNMPDIGNDALSIAVGDFKSAYKIVDRSGIQMLRDPYTEKPFIRFYAVKRVGGDVVNPEAIKFAKFSE